MTDEITVEQYRALAPDEKPRKYRNKPVTADGIRFASQAEARRYGELRLLEEAGHIGSLRVHHRWPLDIDGWHITTYTDDFSYVDYRTNRFVVEDVKGVRTEAYRLRKRLMRALWNHDITEVDA